MEGYTGIVPVVYRLIVQRIQGPLQRLNSMNPYTRLDSNSEGSSSRTRRFLDRILTHSFSWNSEGSSTTRTLLRSLTRVFTFSSSSGEGDEN